MYARIVGEDSHTNQHTMENDRLAEANRPLENCKSSNAGRYGAPPQKFRKKNLPENVMTSDERLRECVNLIDMTLDRKLNQQTFDTLYDSMVDMYMKEMAEFLQEIKKTPKSKKVVRFTSYAFWDERLSEAWKAYHVAEKVYLKSSRNIPEYNDLRRDFLHKQRLFDKDFKKKKRSFERRRVYDLEEANTSDPNEFWKHIKKLGSNRKTGIPWEVVDSEVNVECDHEKVLDRWKHDFCELLTPPPPDLPEQAQHTVNIEKDNLEKEISLNELSHNEELNCRFSIEETRKIAMRAKSGKAPGVDGLIADILKNEASIRLLSELFTACLENSLIPMVWSLGLIQMIQGYP